MELLTSKTPDLEEKLKCALCVVERDGIDGEIKVAREAFNWTYHLLHLMRAKSRNFFPYGKQIESLAGELLLFNKLVDDDEPELRDAVEVLVGALRGLEKENFQFASKKVPLTHLSPAQLRVIMRGEHASQPSTIRVLEEKGFVTSMAGRVSLTDEARDYAWRGLDHGTFKMLAGNDALDVRLIQSDLDLLELMMSRGEVDQDVSIYVYRGHTPMVVRNGDGQKPLAYLHRYYLWQIEVDRTRGEFLERVSFVSGKGSYGYKIKKDALA